MLASPAEDADEIITRLGPEVWVEDKYDGIRAQLHKRGPDVRLYSRDLHDVSGQFPEVVEAAAAARLGRRPRRRDPRLEGRRRPAVHQPPDAARAQVAVRRDPGRGPGHLRRLRRCWRSGPATTTATDRRAAAPRAADRAPARGSTRSTCRRVEDGGRFARSHLVVAADADALEAAFADARARRNEGLMVKDPASGYSPGRRGLGWLKMKKALATIDCVVVGVEVGHGKRHGVLSDYTFAVRDTERPASSSTSARPTAA